MILKSINIGPHLVPGIWQYALPEDFHHFRFPKESKSTCMTCPKVCAEGFDAQIRCCTYHPRVANFMLGLALFDPDVSPLIDQLIAVGLATPEGMQQTARQQELALEKHVADQFGKNRDVVCRFLDLGSSKCRFYNYRNAVCSTFFCINDQGEKGNYFWQQVQNFVTQIETALSQWAMQELGFDVDQYMQRFNALADNLPAVSTGESWSAWALQQLWSNRYQHEAEFYRECAALILQHKDSLYDIACSVTIKAPHAYDAALRDSFSTAIQRMQDQNAPVGGTPVPISDLWYLVQKAQRDLWRPS